MYECTHSTVLDVQARACVNVYEVIDQANKESIEQRKSLMIDSWIALV
jgi:hypothetical protein